MFNFAQNSRARRAGGACRTIRPGAATVELAIILPVFVIMIFGSLEVCQRLFTRQAVVIAAYESARTATRRNCNSDTVADKCRSLLEQSGIKGATVQVRDVARSLNHLKLVETGDEIRVRIKVPWMPNSISRFVVRNQGEFEVNAVMLRE